MKRETLFPFTARMTSVLAELKAAAIAFTDERSYSYQASLGRLERAAIAYGEIVRGRNEVLPSDGKSDEKRERK